jgi:DNA repair protein RadA/Sms
MARPAVSFVCNACAAESLKWQGQCPQCGEWNSLEQRRAPLVSAASRGAIAASAVRPARLEAGEGPGRLPTGLAELDRVLGGGLVPGSVSLIGGDPGIGKSTLLLQVAASAVPGRSMLYATGEESLAQVSLRARRLGLASAGLTVLAETDLEAILDAAREAGAALLIVDSIQTVQFNGLGASAGAVTQLKECTAQLVRFAKTTGIAIVIIGHVTKEGAIAGPRVLEHLVDAVLYFESEAGSRYRIVRAVKNRFGAVNELAFFVMAEEGLKEVRNPSAIFLARAAEPAPGSIVMVARDSGRPLLIELQALVDRMRFGAPRRVAQGLDANRLAMLLAILNRHAGVSLQEHDVFANVVGGLSLGETATDLPLVLALTSSLRDRPLPQALVAFGEVGLTGEVRPVAYGEERLREAAKQGFKVAVVPQGNVPRKPVDGLTVRGVSRVAEAIAAAESG